MCLLKLGQLCTNNNRVTTATTTVLFAPTIRVAMNNMHHGQSTFFHVSIDGWLAWHKNYHKRWKLIAELHFKC